MSIPRKIVYNVAVSTISKVLSTVGALINIALITRYLGQDAFGLYITALAFFLFFNSIGDWGLYQTMTRKISRPNAEEGKIVSNVAGLRVTISLLIVLLAPVIISFLPYPKELKIALIIISFAFFFSSFTQMLVGLFQKRLLMDRVALTELAGKVLQVTLVFVGVKLDLGFNFIVSTLLATMAFNFFVVLIISRKYIKFKLSFDFAYWKKILIQAAPIGLSVVVTFVYFKADSIILSLLRPISEVGIYGAAYKIIENLSFFPSMIVGLTMPLFAYNIFTNREKFILIVNKNFKVFIIMALPLVIGAVMLSEGIINVIAGPEFISAAPVLKIIIFSIAFIFFGHLFNSILIAAKLQKQLFWALLAAAIFNLTLNLLLIPKYSYIATSYISVATELLVVLFGALITYKYLKFFPKADGLFAIFLSATLMVLYLLVFQNLPFFVLMSTCPLVYFGGLLLLGGIKKEELMLLLKKDRPTQNT